MFAAASALTAASLVWFALGDRSEPRGYMSLFRPPAVPRGLEVLIAAALLAAMVTLLAAVCRLRSGALTAMCAATGAAGVYAGFTARVLTSLTVGANIGGGLLILAAPFVTIPLSAIAVVCWFHLARS